MKLLKELNKTAFDAWNNDACGMVPAHPR